MQSEHTPPPSGIHLDHIHLKVGHLERSVRFYVALGATLEARYRFGDVETAALLLGGIRVNISSGGSGADRFDHIGVAIPGLDDRYEGLAEHGCRLLREPRDWLPDEVLLPSDRLPLRGRFAFVEGPGGEFIELVSPRAQ